MVQTFIPDCAAIALDAAVLPGLSRSNVLDRDVAVLGPDQQFATDVFRAVVELYGARLAAPFDDTLGWRQEADLDLLPLTDEIVQHVQLTKCTPDTEAIRTETPLPCLLLRLNPLPDQERETCLMQLFRFVAPPLSHPVPVATNKLWNIDSFFEGSRLRERVQGRPGRWSKIDFREIESTT